MDLLFKILGIIGLVLIILGVISKSKKREDILFLIGGVFLISYSIYIEDFIFMLLQAFFIFAAMYGLYTQGKFNKKKPKR